MKFLKNKFIYLFLAELGLCCGTDLSLVATSRGYSLVAVLRLLIAVASLVGEHGLSSTQASGAAARGLSSCGATWLSCSVARGIFPDQELNSCPLD